MKKRALAAILVCRMFALTCSVMASNKIFEPADIFKDLKNGEKAAILMVHFGTTHADTRTLTIDAINRKAKEHFPDVEVREAYTSRIIIKRLKDRGIEKPNPLEALNRNVDAQRAHFKEIRVATPPLFWVGHGTYDASTAQYAMLDYMLKEKGLRNFVVGCIEG